ncbi:MAG: ATP-grasp domain-containing protein [Coriobacteriia bacterium]|nr:ATP-grasp domain-containing protein [Coriobacteriia bacterium]
MAYKVAIIVGGGATEREFSIKSGANVSQALQLMGHSVVMLDTTADLIPSLCQEAPDCAYIAIPGKQGESGAVQAVLEFVGIPFIGPTSAACEHAWNKFNLESTMGAAHSAADSLKHAAWPKGFCLSKRVFEDLGARSALDVIERNIESYPVVVKPSRGVGAQSVHKVESPDQLFPACADVFALDDKVIIQQWITGVEVSVSVVELPEGTLVLPPVEIVPKKGWYDRASRVDSSLVDYYAPVRSASLFPEEGGAQAIQSEIKRAALEVFHAFGLRDLARIDMIWNGKKPCVLEVNVAPNVTDISMLPAACRAAGRTFPEVLDKLVKHAVARGANATSV